MLVAVKLAIDYEKNSRKGTAITNKILIGLELHVYFVDFTFLTEIS
jgi:hypothetical protein